MKCSDCRSKCCSIFDVQVNKKDAKRISEHLNVSDKKFISSYCESVDGRNYLRYKKISTGEDFCIFINPKDFRCRIYEVRPKMCRDFECARYEGLRDMNENKIFQIISGLKTVREMSVPLRLPRFLWHGTKYLEFIAIDDLVMKTPGRSGYVEGIRFTSDPRNLKQYEVYPFWIKISTRKLRPSDFEHRDEEGYLYRDEDEYLYIAGERFDLKPHIEAIYAHKKVDDYFHKPAWKGRYYANVEKVVEKYNIPLIFGEKWLW